jgi:rhodanese-related sulfurtransferase
MKKTGLLVVLLILMAVSAIAAPRNINSGEAKELLAKNKKVYLLDVRTADEFRQARIKGAVLLPMNDLQLKYYEIPRDRPVLVYCAVGSRSAIAASFLAEKGYKDVYQMADGLVGWYRSGYPLER